MGSFWSNCVPIAELVLCSNGRLRADFEQQSLSGAVEAALRKSAEWTRTLHNVFRSPVHFCFLLIVLTSIVVVIAFMVITGAMDDLSWHAAFLLMLNSDSSDSSSDTCDKLDTDSDAVTATFEHTLDRIF